jgi:hypothetical protein
MIPAVGDTVLLIYVGLVKVRSVDADGTIHFWLYGKEHRASRSQYRVRERWGPYIQRYGEPKDYTSHDEGPSLAALTDWLEEAGLTIDDVEIDDDGTIRRRK